MSIKVMSTVWDAFPGGGSELLALLALADWSDDEGRCWPSIAAIAKKTRLSRSQTQRTVHGLIGTGYVALTGNETGGAPGSTRQYRIVLSSLTGRTDATPTGSAHATGRAGATGSTHAQDGSHGCTQTGSAHATQTVSEPSVHVNPREQARSAAPVGEKTKKRESCAVAPHGGDPQGFADCWSAYPKRHGGNSRKEAVIAYRARVRSGATPEDLLAGVKRYAAFIRADGKEGTAYVKQASTFFGPAEHWRELWGSPADADAQAGDWRAKPMFKGAI